MFDGGTVSDVFRVEVIVVLGSNRRLDDDEVTGMIEAVIDELDRLPVEPSVATARVGDDVEMTVELSVDQSEEIDALAHGIAAMKGAFRTAGIGIAGTAQPRDLRSHVTPLQAA
jgi:hypothetical protein